MTQSTSWNEICRQFPNEWIVVVQYRSQGSVAVDGIVIAHGHNKSVFRGEVAKAIKKYGRAAVRYTGDLVQESELPLLWQIFHTH